MFELAARMATVAQAYSEWYRRMTSEKLNQADRPSMIFNYKSLPREIKPRLLSDWPPSFPFRMRGWIPLRMKWKGRP